MSRALKESIAVMLLLGTYTVCVIVYAQWHDARIDCSPRLQMAVPDSRNFAQEITASTDCYAWFTLDRHTRHTYRVTVPKGCTP